MTGKVRPGQQCPADHIVQREGGKFYYYCVLDELHDGQHKDIRGNRWTLLWPHLSTAFRGHRKQRTRY